MNLRHNNVQTGDKPILLLVTIGDRKFTVDEFVIFLISRLNLLMERRARSFLYLCLQRLFICHGSPLNFLFDLYRKC